MFTVLRTIDNDLLVKYHKNESYLYQIVANISKGTK